MGGRGAVTRGPPPHGADSQWMCCPRAPVPLTPTSQVSILPFDTLGVIFGSGAVSRLKILRIMRLLRLLKLISILKSSR